MARRKSDTDQLKIRLSSALRSDLEEAADYEGRSLNAEIVKRLTDSLRRESVVELNEMAMTFLDVAIDVVYPARGEATLWWPHP